MATHYHCVDREQIRLCTCLQSVFDPSSRTFVEDEQEIQSKQPSDPHKLLGKKKMDNFIRVDSQEFASLFDRSL